LTFLISKWWAKFFSKNADFWKTRHNFYPKFFWVNFSTETKSAPKINKIWAGRFLPCLVGTAYLIQWHAMAFQSWTYFFEQLRIYFQFKQWILTIGNQHFDWFVLVPSFSSPNAHNLADVASSFRIGLRHWPFRQLYEISRPTEGSCKLV
jgi:hypothetical protein